MVEAAGIEQRKARHNMATDNFTFDLSENFLGYNSSGDKTTVTKGTLIKGSKNVIKKLSGTVASREGLKLRTPADTTDAGIKTGYIWNTNRGNTRSIRVANSKLEVESSVTGTRTWYELFATGALTTSLASTYVKYIFDTWWNPTEKKDRLVMVRGDDKILHWSGGITTVSSVTQAVAVIGDINMQTSNWSFSGLTTSNTAPESDSSLNVDAFILHYKITGTASSFQIDVYKDSDGIASNRVATGSGTANGVITLSESNSSGVTGSVTMAFIGADTTVSSNILLVSWNITKQGTTTWKEENFASQDVNVDFTEVAEDSGQLASWVLNGVNKDNSTGMVLYFTLVNSGSTRTVRLFSRPNSDSSFMVASGSRNSDGSITLTAQNSSGVTGSVTVTYSADDLDVYSNALVPQYSAEKKIIISGVEYTYKNGETTTTIAGVTPDPSAIGAGTIVIQSVLIADDEPIDGFGADVIKTIHNQLFVGSYNSRIVYISANIVDPDFPGEGGASTADDPFDFENTGTFVPGDPDSIMLDNPLMGIGERDGKALIFAGDSDLYVVTPNVNVPVSFTDPISGTSRFMITEVSRIRMPALTASKSQEFIGNFSGYLVWVDKINQLRALGSFANLSEIQPSLLSLPVQTELKDEDFSGGHLDVIGDTIHITAPNTGRDWLYQVRETIDAAGNITSERLWHPPQIRSLVKFGVIDGVIHGFSNKNPQLYEIEGTSIWHDETPEGTELPYACVAKFSFIQANREKTKLGKFDKTYFEGYLREGSEIEGTVFFDYGGATALQQFFVNEIDKEAKFYSPITPLSLGQSSLGENSLGDGLVDDPAEQEQLAKFRAVRDLTAINCFEYALQVASVTPDARWEILRLGVNPEPATELPVFLRK